MTATSVRHECSEPAAGTIWTLHVDSIYEWSGDSVRRVTGCSAPTARQGSDGCWRGYTRLLLSDPPGWEPAPHPVPHLLGRSYALDWAGDGKLTPLSTMVASSSTPLWGRSFWCRPSDSAGKWEVVAANQTIAVAPTAGAALVIAALAHRGPGVMSAAVGARTAATHRGTPAIEEWHAVDVDPCFGSPSDGWRRPWPDLDQRTESARLEGSGETWAHEKPVDRGQAF